MTEKSIRDIALGIGVELASRAEQGDVRAEEIHRVLHQLAEDFVRKLGTADLASIIGANPDLLVRRVPFDAVEDSFEKAMRETLKWAVIEGSSGYRASAEASVVSGRVVSTMTAFAERLREKADQGVYPSEGVSNVTVFVERVVRRGEVDDVDKVMLNSIVGQMGSYAGRIRKREAAKLGIAPDRLHDGLLDAVQDLAFLATSSPAVLFRELQGELAGTPENEGRPRVL